MFPPAVQKERTVDVSLSRRKRENIFAERVSCFSQTFVSGSAPNGKIGKNCAEKKVNLQLSGSIFRRFGFGSSSSKRTEHNNIEEVEQQSSFSRSVIDFPVEKRHAFILLQSGERANECCTLPLIDSMIEGEHFHADGRTWASVARLPQSHRSPFRPNE